MADPVSDYLKSLNTSDRARASAWDAVYSVKDDAQVQQLLAALPFSDDVRAKLWDARSGTMPTVTAAPVQPQTETPAALVSAGGRGTRLDVRKSDEFGQGAASAVPFGPDTPQTARGVAGRVAGEGVLFALPVEKAVEAAKAILPSSVRAGQAFGDVMSAAKDVPVGSTEWGDAALRVKQLADRGGRLPKPVNDLLKRATDPTKGDIPYAEMRDFYSNITRLSADEWGSLTAPMKRAVGELRVSLNDALASAADTVGKGDVYQGAMNEYRNAARLREGAKAVKGFIVKKVLPAGATGAAAAYGAKQAWDAIRAGNE